MHRCLQLASLGAGKVAPNPMVGAVLVHNSIIIGEGYHQQFGQAHAEVNCINSVSEQNKELISKSTLYVSLEPCAHFGKTPPCADLIISKGIKKVVVGNLDTNPLVAGKGIKKLQDAGIQVEYGILNDACRELNKRFFTFHEKKRPYVILKWAQTEDGFISRLPLPTNKEDNWITNKESKQLVHTWRAQEQAILVGYNTALTDNPLLTVRIVNGKNPMRIVIDEHLQLPHELHIFNTDAETIVFNALENNRQNNIEFIKIDFTNLIQEILSNLFAKNISSIIIEGGTKTIELFMKTNLWDEARVFVNPLKVFEVGIKAPEININKGLVKNVGSDNLYTIFNNSF